MNIPAICLRQDGTTLYVAAIRAGELISRTKPDVFRQDGDRELGYQRAPERSRALTIARFLSRKQVVLPTAVVLGARGKLPYSDSSGTLTIPDDVEFFEVDGQHREAGFRVAIEEQGVERLRDFPLVTVIIENTTEDIEAEQFRVINETAKKVRTDLARRILARLASVGPLSRRREAAMGRRWEVEATKVLALLRGDPSSVWYQRIQMPNERKTAEHIVKEKSFGDSLRPLLSTYPFERMSETRVAEGVNEYWHAWADVMAEAPDAHEYADPFEAPADYVLQKTAPGVLALHLVLRDLWSISERKGVPFTREHIKTALLEAGARARDTQDDFISRRPWHGEDGQFAFFGGLKGAKGLADLIIEYLSDAGYTIESD